jgi:hypothetical protein
MVIKLEGSIIRVGKKHPKNKKGQRLATQKGWLWYNVGLTQGQEPNEET